MSELPHNTPAEVRRRPRLVVLQTHPIQYYAPLYRTLAERGILDIHVVYLTDAGALPYFDEKFGQQIRWDIPLLDGYEHTILSPDGAVGDSFATRTAPNLVAVLKSLSPDWLMVYGYSGWFIWQAMAWAKRNAIRVAYSSDSNLRNQARSWKVLAKQLVLRPFFSRIDACFATSEANADYLAFYGVPTRRVHRVPFAIDVARFQEGAKPIGSPRRFDFVWAGKLIDVKCPHDLLEALAMLGAEVPSRQISVAMVGDGDLRPGLEARAAALPANCRVEFFGFVNQRAMPAILQDADTMVFTSRQDAYGLSATEAAACGLALVVTDNIGCVGPTVLARPGENALTYSAGDLAALTEAMRLTLTDVAQLHRMQAASLEISRGHGFESAALVMEGVLNRGEAA